MKTFRQAVLLHCLLAAIALHGQTKIRVVNDGCGGCNSAEIAARFHGDVERIHPSYVLIFTGMNDAANDKKFLTVEESISSIASMIRDTRAQRATPILISVHDVDEKRVLLRHDPKAYGSDGPNARIGRLDKALSEFASREGVALADFRLALKLAGGANERLSTDGVHLTREGYSLLARTARAALPEHLPDGTILLCVGDSLTMGIGVRPAIDPGPREDSGPYPTYPAQLSALLNGGR